jgi:hypothetical protein
MSEVRKIKYNEQSEKIKSRVFKYRLSNPDKIKNSKLKQTYGITLDQFKQMSAEQNGVCAVCKNPETVVWKGKLVDLSVDHSHETGDFRDLLCVRCNRALDALRENRNSILALLDYVDKHLK